MLLAGACQESPKNGVAILGRKPGDGVLQKCGSSALPFGAHESSSRERQIPIGRRDRQLSTCAAECHLGKPVEISTPHTKNEEHCNRHP